MTIELNALRAHFRDAKQNYADAKLKDAENDYDDFELTIERIESGGFVDGYQFGAQQGYLHAIARLEAEGFSEHANVLRDQLQEVLKIVESIES